VQGALPLVMPAFALYIQV